MSPRKILVTSALPYANGDIHLGHLVEYLQTDFWVRFQKMRGHDCIYICADDTHGTPIMIAAQKSKVTPEAFIAAAHKAHLKDFTNFEIEFDHFGSTHSTENKKWAEFIFLKMSEKGHIHNKNIRQSYCEKDGMFLPDRFVVGTCPKCSATQQYGDACDNCGSTYAPTELKDAKCAICSSAPTERESEHLFFKLSNFQDFLREWVPAHTQTEVSNKLQEWLSSTLKDWDISRDAPYFGFEIPNHPSKYFYVWLDAPIGYISSTEQWCVKHGGSVTDYWQQEIAEIYHFIGKDIVYFHTLFWPAMLEASNLRTPTKIFVHGFLRVNGEKMSKSKGTFINAKTFHKHINPLHLRYYYACKMGSSVDDIDLSFDDLVTRVNSDLVGKITNVASRCAQLLGKNYSYKLSNQLGAGSILISQAQSAADRISDLYEAREFSRALIEIRQIADETNRFFDEKQPWKLVKEDQAQAHEIITSALNLFRILAVYLKPILPSYVTNVEKLFGESAYCWADSQTTITSKTISPYEHLVGRLDPKSIEAVVNDSLPS